MNHVASMWIPRPRGRGPIEAERQRPGSVATKIVGQDRGDLPPVRDRQRVGAAGCGPGAGGGPLGW